MTERGTDDTDEPSFSLQDFKKWMSENAKHSFNLEPKPWGVGIEVEPKLPYKKMVTKMEPTDGDLSEMAREFRRSGGTIARVDGVYFLVEVTNGSFVVPKTCVRRRD